MSPSLYRVLGAVPFVAIGLLIALNSLTKDPTFLVAVVGITIGAAISVARARRNGVARSRKDLVKAGLLGAGVLYLVIGLVAPGVTIEGLLEDMVAGFLVGLIYAYGLGRMLEYTPPTPSTAAMREPANERVPSVTGSSTHEGQSASAATTVAPPVATAPQDGPRSLFDRTDDPVSLHGTPL